MVGPKRAAFAEESAEVEVLFADLAKMKSLTKKIQSSMSRLETSGKTVQDAIGPIYGNTQKLQTTNANIDRVIMAIDRIREPLDMRNQEERIIRSSPQKVGLTEYVASIDRTRQALRDLKQSNLRSNQQAISDLNGLLKTGTQQLEAIFRDTLREAGVQPVEPLHYITKDLEFPRLPSNSTSQLRTINSYVAASAAEMSPSDAKGTPTAKTYAEIRGKYLSTSLQNMATACVATARKQHSDTIYKRGDNAIGMYASGIKGMYMAEYDNICPVFPRDDWGHVLALTCQSSLDAFASTLRDLDRHVRDNLSNDCFLAFEIIEVVSKISLEIQNTTGEMKLALADALKPVRETAKSSLSSLLADVRTRVQQIPQLPMDGTAVPMTVDVMIRMQTMTGFLAPLSSVLISLGDGGWTSASAASSSSSIPTLKSFDVGADGIKLFAHYAADTIDTLMSNLEARGKMIYKGQGLLAVFLANNIAIVERMIRNSELQSLMVSVMPRIEAIRTKQLKTYTSTWTPLSKYLLDTQYTNRGPRPPSTGTAVDSAAFIKALNSKDKDALKERWKMFNNDFDEMVSRHKSFKMEREVKTAFGGDVQKFVEPLYQRHWDRYHEIDKGKGKYVKYDKNQINGVLSSLS